MLLTNAYVIHSGIGYTFLNWLSEAWNYAHTDQDSKGSVANDLKVDPVFLGLTAFADPWVLMR